MTIAENVAAVRENIARAAAACGADAGAIRLVAASKMNPAEKVREAIAAGVDACGENRVQEMVEKRVLGAYEGAPLHFIGHLQRNKVNQTVGAADLIESCGSEELLRMISARAQRLGIVQDVLIQVNIGREEQKSGIAPEQLGEILGLAAEEKGVRVRGLMTVPPIEEKPGGNAFYFDGMYKLFVDMAAKKYDNVIMEFLSMGMSADYPEAIAAGANMVRVGTAIFGARNYNTNI